jgi:integrase/recombinase XerD
MFARCLPPGLLPANIGDLRLIKFSMVMTARVIKKHASVDVVLRTGHANPEGKMPVRVAVIYDRKARYYPVNYEGQRLYLFFKEWKELHAVDNNGKPVKFRGTKKDIQDAYNQAKAKANEAIKKITGNGQPFTFDRFENEYLQQESKKGFLKLFADHLQQLLKEERIGTYNSYKNAYAAFNKFRGAKYDRGSEITPGRELSPIDVTPILLKDFDSHLRRKGAGKTTVAIYMRGLKVIYNLAADRNPSLLETYPFARKQTDRNRYKIRTGAGHKGEPLTVEQIRKFIALKTEPGLPEHESKLYWLFSFHCQGMNMKDIFLLKYRDIHGNMIRSIRAKTRDTEDKETIMEIPLTDPVRSIIAEIGNPDKQPNSYLFTVIPNGLASTIKRRTPHEKTAEERIHEIIKQKTKMVNARIQQLCKDSGDDDLKGLDLTTYWARHSFASLLKEAGESVEMIRELLGHSDIKTTESYLKRFDIQRKRKVSEKIETLLKAS